MTAVKITKGSLAEAPAGAADAASGETVIHGSHWKLLTKEDTKAEKEIIQVLKAEDKRTVKEAAK